MAEAKTPRNRTKATRRQDSLLGYIIPIFFVVIAAYQQVKYGAIDKFVLGILLIIGISALGWRLDVFFETYMKYRYGGGQKSDNNGDAV
jgi:RsiW-degrading membrane proteinase PrsW (M82 family)